MVVDEQTSLLSRDVEGRITQSRSVFASIGVLLIGVFIANAEGSLVLATSSQISTDLGGFENASWLVTSYILSMSATQPLYGKLSDIFGRTALLLVAYSLFSLGCFICGLAPSFSLAVIGRAISGIGGAGMGSLVSVCITDLVPRRNIALWRSYVNVVATVARALGGPIGGYLADSPYIGWRWSFLGQCPLTLLAIVLTAYFDRSPATSRNSSSIEEGLSTASNRFRRVDWAGSILMVAGILALLLPLELAGQQLTWDDPRLMGCLILSILLICLFALVELRYAQEPIFPLHLLRSSGVVLPYLVTFFQTSAQLGMMYSVPLYFQIIHNSSASVAGSHLIPAVVGVAVSGLLGGYAIKRYGKVKLLLIVATLLSSSCYLLLSIRWTGRINVWESLYIVLGGVGNGLVQAAGFIALTSSVMKADIAVASSGYYLSSNIGTVVGMALTDKIYQDSLRGHLSRALLDGDESKEEIIKSALTSIDFIRNSDGHLREVLIEGCLNGFKNGHLMQFALALAAVGCALLLRESKLDDTESN